MKKRKCMADGGMPQERAKTPDETPEWKKSLAAAWQAITGDSPKREKPATADSLGDTARRIQDRKMENTKSARYKDGKVPDPEEVMRRMAAKYGGTAAVSTEPKQAILQPKPAPSQQRTMPENIQSRNDQLQQVMDYDKRKFAIGGMPGISRDGNSFYGERDTQSAGAVPSIPGKSDPGIVSSVMDGIKPLAVSTAATPSNLVPTQVQGLVASGGLAGVDQAQEVAATPTPTGNVFANPQAGNMLTSSSGQTMTEKAQSAGINPNAAYRPGSEQDPHASGLSSVTPAQRTVGSNAAAAALAPNQPVPQLAPNPLDVRSSRQKRGFADGGMARQRFEGKGGPREDKIPVKVAGEEIKVSNGEEVVILPAKTAQNPQAIAAISDVIEQSNDGRKPAMGMSGMGKYKNGLMTQEELRKGSFPGTTDVVAGMGEDVNRELAAGNNAAAAGRALRGLVTLPVGVASDIGSLAGRALAPVGQAISTFATGESPTDKPAGMAKAAQQAATYTNEGRPSAIQTANNTPDPRIAQTTGNAGDAHVDPASGNLHFMQKGFDPTQQQFAPGSGAITDPKTGRTIIVPPQAIAPEPDNRPRDRHGNDMTETLRLRDELMRVRVDNALSNLNATNPAYRQLGMAQLAALQQAGSIDDATAKRIGMSQSQEMDSKLKGQQIAQGGLAIQQAQELNALYAAHNAEQNPEKRALIADQIRVRTGKDKPAKYKTAILGGAKTFDGTEADRGYVVNEQTGEMIPMGMIGAMSQITNQEVPPAGERKIGQTYKTPQGPMIWRGNGWEKAA